jgi:hypothetical protein
VPPSSAGSGEFALVFLGANGTEVSRATVEFAPPTFTLGNGETAADGTYSIAFAPLDLAGFQLQAAYAGTGALWPAFATSPPSNAHSVSSNGIVNTADFKVEALPPGKR